MIAVLWQGKQAGWLATPDSWAVHPVAVLALLLQRSTAACVRVAGVGRW